MEMDEKMFNCGHYLQMGAEMQFFLPSALQVEGKNAFSNAFIHILSS
jgi:hypothetical protein